MEILHRFIGPNDCFNHLAYVFVQPHHLIAGIVFFIGIISLLIIYMLFYLVYRERKSRLRHQLRQQYSEFISYLAVCESTRELQEIMDQPEWKNKLAAWLSHSFSRNVLVRELVTTVKNMSGTAAENVSWFYRHTGLDKDSYSRLKKGKWHVKARAIRELAYLKQKQYLTSIYRYTNNRNEKVRNEARVAIVQLTGFEGLRFLDIITYPLTEWEQLCLLHELSLHPIQSFASTSRWLQSPNLSVVDFSLKLIETYKLYELYDEVVNCLSHPDKSIRKKAVEVLKEIGKSDTASLLLQQLKEEEPEVQLTILHVLEQMATENEVAGISPFLYNSRNELKAAAARVIGKVSTGGWTTVEKLINPAASPWDELLPFLKQEIEL